MVQCDWIICCCGGMQALVKRAQELTPGAQEQAAVLNLVTKIQSVLDNLVVAPSLFEAAVCLCDVQLLVLSLLLYCFTDLF